MRQNTTKGLCWAFPLVCLVLNLTNNSQSPFPDCLFVCCFLNYFVCRCTMIYMERSEDYLWESVLSLSVCLLSQLSSLFLLLESRTYTLVQANLKTQCPFSCLCLLSVGIAGRAYHACLLLFCILTYKPLYVSMAVEQINSTKERPYSVNECLPMCICTMCAPLACQGQKKV